MTLAVIGTGAINGLNAVRFAQRSAAHPGEDLPYILPLAVDLGVDDGVRGVCAIFRVRASDQTGCTPGLRIMGRQPAG